MSNRKLEDRIRYIKNRNRKDANKVLVETGYTPFTPQEKPTVLPNPAPPYQFYVHYECRVNSPLQSASNPDLVPALIPRSR